MLYLDICKGLSRSWSIWLYRKWAECPRLWTWERGRSKWCIVKKWKISFWKLKVPYIQSGVSQRHQGRQGSYARFYHPMTNCDSQVSSCRISHQNIIFDLAAEDLSDKLEHPKNSCNCVIKILWELDSRCKSVVYCENRNTQILGDRSQITLDFSIIRFYLVIIGIKQCALINVKINLDGKLKLKRWNLLHGFEW